MKPFILGAIFARGGSKGIPQKNIRLLAGKPLIAYSIEVALLVPLIDRVIVSTDDVQIVEIARQYNADVPFIRPSELSTDSAAELSAWKHAIQSIEQEMKKEVDVLVSIPATSPFRLAEDIEDCINLLLSTDADGVVTATPTSRSPYFNMVTMNEKKDVKVVNGAENAIVRRQDGPQIYDMTTVAYAFRASFIKKTESIMNGKIKAVIIPQERAMDIDTLFDFKIAEILMQRKAEEL